VQRAAAEEFGLEQAAKTLFNPSNFPIPDRAERVAEWQKEYEAAKPVLRAFVRAQYEATQTFLRERFPDATHIRLYRGGDSPQRYRDGETAIEQEALARAAIAQPVDATLMLRPLASFSMSVSRMGAGGFAAEQTMFGADVPIERIMSTAATGNGAAIEGEFVVLGGPIAGKAAMAVSRYEDRRAIEQAAYNVDPTEFITINGVVIPIGKSVAKHYQGTEHDHDQSTHGRRGAGASGGIKVQGHDPYFFRDLAARLGIGSTYGIGSVASTIASDFRTLRREAVEQMIRDGDVDLEAMLGTSRLELLQRLHADDPETFAAVAADGILEPVAGFRIVGDEDFNEDFARRKALAEAVGEQVARDLVESGRINMETFENNLNATVDRIQAKIASQEAVAAGLTGASLDDLHAVASSLTRSPWLHDATENWKDQTVVLAYNSSEREHRIEYLESESPRFDPAYPGRLQATLADAGYDSVVVGSPRDPDFAETYKDALRSVVARKLISEWSKTSNKTGEAASIQRAAAAEFGLDRAAQPLDEWPQGASEQFKSAFDRVARAFVRAQYEATQAMFAEQLPGVTHIRLFRGGDSTQRYAEGAEGLAEAGGIDTYSGADVGALVRLNRAKWSPATLNLRPMASFATTPAASNLFALRTNTTFAADVPIERILSTPFTGNGASIESEFVVLGGPIHGMRIGGQVPKIQGTPKWPIPDDLPLGATEFITIDGIPIPIGKAVAKHLLGTVNDHDQSTHAGNRGVGKRRTELTEDEIARQPEYLKGTTWTVSPRNDPMLGMREVFTDEYLASLGVDLDAKYMHADDVRLDAIRRAVWSGRIQYYDPVNELVALVPREAFDPEELKAEYLQELKQRKPKDPRSPGFTDYQQDEMRVAAELVHARTEESWFDMDRPAGMSLKEWGESRVRQVLESASELQKAAPIGPTIIRLETPFEGLFNKPTSEGTDDYLGIAGWYRKPRSWLQQVTDVTLRKQTLQTIDLNLYQGTVVSDGYYAVMPREKTDEQAPFNNMLSTLVHEWGHAIGHRSGRTEAQREQKFDAYKRATENTGRDDGFFVTEYSLTNSHEMEAEGFAAWFWSRAGTDWSGKYTSQAAWAESNLNLSGRDVDFITVNGQVIPVAKRRSPVGIGCSFDPNVGSLFEYEDGTTEVVNELETVAKHYQGTEHDHDQSTHGRGKGKPFKAVDGYGHVSEVGEWLDLGSKYRMYSGYVDASDVKRAVVQDLATALEDVSTDALVAFVMDHHGAATGFDDYQVSENFSDYIGEPTGEKKDILDLLEERLKWNDESLEGADDAYTSNDGKTPDVIVYYDGEGRISGMDFATTPMERDRMDAYRRAFRDLEREFQFEIPVRFWSSEGGGIYERAGELREHIADVTISSWAETSNLSLQSQALQEAIRDEFSLEVSRFRNLGRLDAATLARETANDVVGDYYRAHRDIFQRLVRHQYERTQQFIRDVYGDDVTHVRLWRGQNWADSLQTETEGRLFPVDVAATNPLSSWSSDGKTALQFAQWGLTTGGEGSRLGVVESLIPVARIFSTPASGVGALNEFEHTVLGGRYGVEAVIDARRDWQQVEGLGAPGSWQKQDTFWVTLPSGQAIPLEDYKPRPLAKHLLGTKDDHDQSTHAGGKGSDVLRYSAPSIDDRPKDMDPEEHRALRHAYSREFFASAFDNDPLSDNSGELFDMPDGRQLNSWQRARSAYVAERVANEDLIVHVNRGLRDGSINMEEGPRHEYTGRVRQFDEMVNGTTVLRDVEVFRAAVLTPEQVDALTAGTEFVDRGFQSSDLTERTAVTYGFSRWAHGGRYQRGMRDGIPVLFRMRLKAGTHAVHVGYNEVVIQRDARVRVMSAPQDMGPAMSDGKRRREFDYIGDPDSGYVHSPNFLVVDVEVSK
jgi:hypothetical protein